MNIDIFEFSFIILFYNFIFILPFHASFYFALLFTLSFGYEYVSLIHFFPILVEQLYVLLNIFISVTLMVTLDSSVLTV